MSIKTNGGILMKDTLQSQLENFKRDNTRASKEALLSTVNSLAGSVEVNDTGSIDTARKVLSSRFTNKNEVVQSVENILSNLE